VDTIGFKTLVDLHLSFSETFPSGTITVESFSDLVAFNGTNLDMVDFGYCH
jgi:hypothetical protein